MVSEDDGNLVGEEDEYQLIYGAKRRPFFIRRAYLGGDVCMIG